MELQYDFTTEELERTKALKNAIDTLDRNKNFKLLIRHYTETIVLENAKNAVASPDIRPQVFEAIIASKHFERFLDDLRNINIDELEKLQEQN